MISTRAVPLPTPRWLRLAIVLAVTAGLLALCYALWLDRVIATATSAVALHEGNAMATAAERVLRLRDTRDLMMRLMIAAPVCVLALAWALRWALRERA